MGRTAGLEVYGLLLTSFSILLLLSLVSFDPLDVTANLKLRSGSVHNLIGPVGAHIADMLLGLFGLTAFFGCSTFFYFGGVLLAGRRPSVDGLRVIAYVITLVFACITGHLLLGDFMPFGHTAGGLVGEWVGEILRALFATTGTVIISASILGAALLTLSGMSMLQMARLPVRLVRQLAEWIERKRLGTDEQTESDATSDERAVDADRPADKAHGGDTALARPDRQEVPTKKRDGKAKRTQGKAAAEAGQSSTPDEPQPDLVIEAPAPPPLDEPLVIGRAPIHRPSYVGESETPAVAPTAKSPVAEPTGDTRTERSVDPDLAPTEQAKPTADGDGDGDGGAGADSAVAPEKTATPDTEPRKKAPTQKKAGIEITDPAPIAEPLISERPNPGFVPLVAAQDSLPLGDKPPFEFPSLSLLDYDPPARQAVDREALNAAARTLEAKLADFGVKGKVVKIQPGPVVTMFEFLPAAGVKISKIANLADDLTMALHAQRVRIVAPIPGKGVVGVEVPSAVRETVYLKEIAASKEFQEGRGKLPVCLGKDIVGHPVVADLARMPHVLVAGSTGSGKSVAINCFILSLIYKIKPADLRLIMVDPKMLELSIYDDIPHLLLPVVTDANKASLALKWAVAEMERRYRLLAAVGVRNIAGFNAKIEKYHSGAKALPDGIGVDELEHIPYIVIILDELADLMMVAKKDVETSIARLAQMARAAGIHLVVATQRPSVDVVTGLIKANFPTRISFMVSQKVDSRTILDRGGAEALLGRGDMLYMPPGTSKLVRVQGAFVSDEEVERITDHLKQFGPPDYDMAILIDDETDQKDLSEEAYDKFFDEAVAIVTETRNPSISYLQRRLKIGYNRSARIIERMEYDGIISKPDHRGVRKVLAGAAPEFD